MALNWADFANGAGLQSIRNAINAFNNSVVTETATLQSGINTNAADIAALEAPQDVVRMNPITKPAHVEGQFYYNIDSSTFNIQGKYPGIEVSPGHGEHIHVINNSGVTIEKGMAVRFNGVSAGIPQIVKAQANTFANAKVQGIAVVDIPNGTESAIAVSGIVSNLDTNLLPVGTPMYLSATVPGTYTSTPPDIKTVIGGILVADATIGSINLDITVNAVSPSVYGALEGLTPGTETYAVTTVAQDIVNYVNSNSIVVTTDKALGTITLPSQGQYRATVTAAMTFPSSTSTRSITIELYDNTDAIVHFPYVKNIPRDATQDSLSFSWPLSEVGGNVHKIRIKGSTAIDITFDEIAFGIQSINI